MRLCRRDDRVDGLNDALKRRVGAYRHVGATKIVIDRADETNNLQISRRTAFACSTNGGARQLECADFCLRFLASSGPQQQAPSAALATRYETCRRP